MRAGLTSEIFCSAVVIAPAKWRKPGHKYSRQLRLKLSVPQIYLCWQMGGCNFKCCHTKDLLPDTRNVFSSASSGRPHVSRLSFRCFSDVMLCFFFLSGKLEIRLLGCEDLLKPLTKPEQENLPEDSGSFTARRPEEPPGKSRFGADGPNFGILFHVTCSEIIPWADLNSLMTIWSVGMDLNPFLTFIKGVFLKWRHV